MAGLIGFNLQPSERLQLSVLYRNYGNNYHNLFAQPFQSGNSTPNEEGLYLGFRLLPFRHVSLDISIYHYRYKWLRYRKSRPSIARDYLFQANFNFDRSVSFYFRYRLREKQEDYEADYRYFTALQNLLRQEFRIQVEYRLSESFVLKNRLETVNIRGTLLASEYGFLFYQDVLFRPPSIPLELTFRFCLFETKSYNSRIYTYENDLLYTFSVPAFFGKGQRYYLLLRYKIIKQLDLRLRISQTFYPDRFSIGSGYDEIDGNKKTELRIQLIGKF